MRRIHCFACEEMGPSCLDETAASTRTVLRIGRADNGGQVTTSWGRRQWQIDGWTNLLQHGRRLHGHGLLQRTDHNPSDCHSVKHDDYASRPVHRFYELAHIYTRGSMLAALRRVSLIRGR
jgi:hypothetical protein